MAHPVVGELRSTGPALSVGLISANLMALGRNDDYAHWRLGPDGRWTRFSTDAEGRPLGDLQAALIAMHDRRRRKARRR